VAHCLRVLRVEIHQPARNRSAGTQGLSCNGKFPLLCDNFDGLNSVLKVAFFALCMGLAGLIFFYIGISMGWLYVRYLLLSQNKADGN
jgi:hypothetical protein